MFAIAVKKCSNNGRALRIWQVNNVIPYRPTMFKGTDHRRPNAIIPTPF